MRGKDFRCLGKRTRSRITPAYAGKSKSLRFPRTGSKDHPRVCGEKPAILTPWVKPPGSPPRVRGKVCTAEHDERQPGITPAYAEKRIKLRKRHSICGDHPRVCGEKPFVGYRAVGLWGSPPRVRGKGGSGLLFHRVWWDHPRVCGEKFAPLLYHTSKGGSPPRMRGKV